MKRRTGTREWAEKTVNIQVGCANNCRYCYARASALRFGRIRTREDWTTPRPLASSFKIPSCKRVMFPSTHDIDMDNVGRCIVALKAMLEAGNEVLIVSKPDPDAIACLRAVLRPWKTQVLFRFTIGAADSDILRYWEPGAPSFEQRVVALGDAFEDGWRTSVSIEPMLDSRLVCQMVERLALNVTDTIWIGKMNKIRARVKIENAADQGWVSLLQHWQSDDRIRQIYSDLKDNPKVRWKDSIRQVVGLPESEEAE